MFYLAHLVEITLWKQHLAYNFQGKMNFPGRILIFPRKRPRIDTERITYKITTMAFSCVHGTCPAYFSDVCTPDQTVAGRAKLRSVHHGHLIVAATKSKTFGNCSFRSAAPTVWNSLPTKLLDFNIGQGQFASGLKTWLFGCAYT